jgi:hypothetical protein
MEREEYIQKSNYQVAKEAKAKLFDKASNLTEEDIERYRWPDNSEDKSFTRLGIQQTVLNTNLLEASVNEIPALKEYLERGGRVSVTREWLPRGDRPRTRISLTKEGVVWGGVEKGGHEFPLGNKIATDAGHNGAIDKLSKLSPGELLKRVARRISPRNIGK